MKGSNGEVWLLGKLIKKYNGHDEAMQAMNNPEHKKEKIKYATFYYFSILISIYVITTLKIL